MSLALAFAGPAGAAQLIGLGSGSSLFSFDSATPNTVTTPVPITGLQAGEMIHGIDFRPANGQLYGFGSTFRLYVINQATGAATAVAPPSFTVPGSVFGVDFNPVADRLQVVSNSGQRLRINPVTGAPDGAPGSVSYAIGDPNFGAPPAITALGFTNSVAGASSTMLYGIDTNLDVLVMVNPDTGALNTVGALGVGPGPVLGFDISGATDESFFAAGFPGSSFAHLVNRATGAAPSAGTIPISFVSGLTFVPVASPSGPGPGPGPSPSPGPTPGPGPTEGPSPGVMPTGDFDLDGDVDAADFIIFRQAQVGSNGLRVDVEAPDSAAADQFDLLNTWRANFGARTSATKRPKQSVLLSARTTLRAGQRRRVVIPLTKAGKRFIRGYKRERLKVSVTLTVTHRRTGRAAKKRTFKRDVTVRVERPKRRR